MSLTNAASSQWSKVGFFMCHFKSSKVSPDKGELLCGSVLLFSTLSGQRGGNGGGGGCALFQKLENKAI